MIGEFFNEIDKANVCNSIVAVCNTNDWNFERNVKTQNWKADIVVDYGSYKVAFNISKSPRKVKETYQLMRKDRVCGCWLILTSKKSSYFDKELPCFYLTENTDLCVCLEAPYMRSTNTIILSDFVKSIVEGHIRWAKEMKVSHIDLCFVDYSCYHCKAANHIYFLSRLYSAEGIELDALNNIDLYMDLGFSPNVVKAVQHYITNNPELGIRLGAIKPRYSKQSDSTYMSFGCCKCDSLFGNHYVKDIIMEECYNMDYLMKAKIDVSDANIIIPAMCWYKAV